MTVNRMIKRGLLTALMAALVAGCTSDRFFKNDLGESYRAGFAAQVLHPEHPLPGESVDPIPGDLAREIYEKRYVSAMTEAADDDDDDKLSRQLK